MKKVGLVGWRGMVGSCLMERLEREGDLAKFSGFLFSASLKKQINQKHGLCDREIKDAHSIEDLQEMDIIVSCQGGEYTGAIHSKLRAGNWNGFWLDASSSLRMNNDCVIVLDPVNKKQITRAIETGVRDFSGGNCTVSLMLMALGGLFNKNQIEWISGHTYQAASGAGAKGMLELLKQTKAFGEEIEKLDSSQSSALEIEEALRKKTRDGKFPLENFGSSLSLSAIPWIDSPMPNGQTREEWKAQAEANKILGSSSSIPIDGTCVRIPTLRSHAQALTVKLSKNLSVSEIEETIASHNPWVKIVPNQREAVLNQLTPQACSGKLDILAGRIRKLSLGPEYINVFTVGDQLLWGAAEPLRRALLMLLEA